MSNPSEETGSTARPVRARLEKFADLDAFVAGYSQYFFDGGMLLPTRSPRDVGARIHLQLEIRGGVVVVRADGVVERIRTAPDGSPVGMVVRFESTDEVTAALIQRILSERRTRRTADHPVVPSAPAPTAAPAPAAPPQAATAPSAPAAAPDAGEALDAIASSLDETFDAIFGGSDRVTGSSPAVGFTPAPEPSPEPASPAAPATLAPLPAPTEEPAAHRVAPAPAVPRGTMVGMPAFDVAAFLEQRQAEAPPSAEAAGTDAAPSPVSSDSGLLTQPASPDADPAEAAHTAAAPDGEDDARADESGVDPRSSQPLGRLALQRVARGTGPDTRPTPAIPAQPASAAKTLVKAMTGELQSITGPAEGSDGPGASDAVDRLLSIEPAPVPDRSSEDVLDDILGDLSAPPARMPTAPHPTVGDAPLVPTAEPPRGVFGRLLAWLRALFA